MVRSVALRTMTMHVGMATRQQPFERVFEICLRTGTGLHQRETGGGVRGENVDEPVASSLGRESLKLARQITEPLVPHVDF